MDKPKALVGIVAALGGVYTVHYARTIENGNHAGGIAARWHIKDLFRDIPADTPILRFDLAAEMPHDPVFLNGDYYWPTMFDRDIRDTAAWIECYRSQGVPVQTAADVLADQSIH